MTAITKEGTDKVTMIVLQEWGLIDESVMNMYMYLCVVGGEYTGHHC